MNHVEWDTGLMVPKSSLIQIQRYRKDQFIQVIKITVECQEQVE